MKNIVYLYTEIMPYQTVVYRVLSSLNYNIHVIYLDCFKQTPYSPPNIPNVSYYAKSTFGKQSLINFIFELNPTLMVVAGWTDYDYLSISRKIKSSLKIPVVCVIDTQYLKKFKQILGILSSKFFIKPCFSHMWVPGVRQYEFARLLGFNKNKIIFNSLSGDIDVFFSSDISIKAANYPKYFLFVGRYTKAKGLALLIDVWNSIENKKGWTLTLIGNGPLKNELMANENIVILDFLTQPELVLHAQKSGCFILPSTFEPWALVLQEFAATGLPLISSDACGASTLFIEHGYNGYIFKSGDKASLKNYMTQIIDANNENLILMSERSRYLSKRVTPEISAYSLISTIES